MRKDHEHVTVLASCIFTVICHAFFDKYCYFPLPQFPKQQDHVYKITTIRKIRIPMYACSLSPLVRLSNLKYLVQKVTRTQSKGLLIQE